MNTLVKLPALDQKSQTYKRLTKSKIASAEQYAVTLSANLNHYLGRNRCQQQPSRTL